MYKRILAALALTLSFALTAHAERARPLVTMNEGAAMLANDPGIARAGITREVLQCLSRPRGSQLPGIFHDMFDPQLNEGIYSKVQPNLAIIGYAQHLQRVPRGRLLEHISRTERDSSYLRAALDDPRLKQSYGLIGDAGNILAPSALGLLDMAGKKTLGALHTRLRNVSFNTLLETYVNARNRTGSDQGAMRLMADMQFDTGSREAQNLRYAWRTASAELGNMAQQLRINLSGDQLLNRILQRAYGPPRSYSINTNAALEAILRSQLSHAKRDAVRALIDHNPEIYQCVDNPDYVPERYADTSGDSVALQNCLCGCLVGKTNFSCTHNTEDRGWSPSCADVSNGACICKAFGCFRKEPPQSGQCHAACYAQHGG